VAYVYIWILNLPNIDEHYGQKTVLFMVDVVSNA